jgi:hypothetical protein
MIVFGLDPMAGRVAAALASDTVTVAHRAPVTALEVTGRGVVADVRRGVGEAMAAARSRGDSFELHLACLVTASAPEGVASLSALHEVCTVLQTLAAGNQTLTICVLAPPIDADDAEKAASFGCFRVLEDLVGALPYVDCVWVNQLASETGRHADVEPGEELVTLLVRELLDPDVCRIVASLGHTAVGWGARVEGRKACYSTLGCYRLEYRADEAAAYIAARLQRDLLVGGLDASRSLDDEECQAIQALVDDASRRCLAGILDRLPVTPRIDEAVLDGSSEAEALGRVLTTLTADADGAVDKVAPTFRELAGFLDGWAARTLVDSLSRSALYLAGGRAFFAALLGRRLHGNQGIPSGVVWIAQELSRQPADQSLGTAARTLLDSLGLASALPQEWPREITLEWLTRTAQALKAREGVAESPTGAPVRLLAGVLGRLEEWSADGTLPVYPSDASLQDIASIYLTEVVSLLERRAATAAAAADTEQAISALPRRYGLISRILTQRRAYNTEISVLARKRAELGGEQEMLERVLRQTRSIIALLFNELLLPRLLRRVVACRVRRETEEASVAFSAFVETMHKSVETSWEQAELFATEQRTTTQARLLTGPRLEALYRATLERERLVLPLAVGDMLCHAPRLALPVSGHGSYRECRGLADHYQHGAQSLLDRLADYAAQKASWVHGLDALDVVECEGRDAANHFLADACARSRRFLDLSPGMLPLAEAHGHPQIIFAARSGAPVASKLAATFGNLFTPELIKVDSNDRQVIEIISLTIGFPAFLIHVLHEGRRLALAEGEQPGEELWPRGSG